MSFDVEFSRSQIASGSRRTDELVDEVMSGRMSIQSANDLLRLAVREMQLSIVRKCVQQAIEGLSSTARTEPFLAKKWRGRP